MNPVSEDVAAFLGRTGDAATADLADTHLPIVTAMVWAYVRGRGFTNQDPADDLALVIVASTARLTANPLMLTQQSSAIDDHSSTVRQAVFVGWTLPELAILHRYRRRAA
ncbi:hypothetical protein BH10ACT10_BH10ACT10_19170 [soil metagenome]